MTTEIIEKKGLKVAFVRCEEIVISDVDTALDFIMSVKYETDCTIIALNSDAIVEDFFILRTRVAGEIMQKFVNYGIRFVIYGDISKYIDESKAMHDFVYESNKSKNINFYHSRDEALEKILA